MAEQLKNMYNAAFFESICPVLRQHIPSFDCSHFIHRVFNNDWPDLEFSERVTHIAKVLNNFLPHEFENAFDLLLRIADDFRNNTGKEQRLTMILINEWLMIFADQQTQLSAALKQVTNLVGADCPMNPSSSKRLALTFDFQLESSEN
jgi:hypothetical protein